MSQTDKGVLIFTEWFEAMEDLKVTEFKTLFYAIYRLQMFGVEPPKFKGKAGMLASIIFPMIRRRTELAKHGARGAETRLSAGKNEVKNDTPENTEASSRPSSHPSSHPSSQTASPLEAKEKNRKEKNRIDYSPSSDSSKGENVRAAHVSRSARARGGKAAKSEEDIGWDEFFEAAIKRSLGKDA